MEINKETRDRIFAAADQLFEQGGRDAFPTVDAVRKLARVNMNDASAGMKEWRRAQTAQAAPIAVKVPEAVQQAGDQAVAVMWQHAQELANESLRAAQAGWDSERALIESVSQQTSQAFDEQAQELETLRLASSQQAQELEAQRLTIEQQAQQIAQLKESLMAMTSEAERHKARSEEIERRANELRTELDHAHLVAKADQAETERLRDGLEQRSNLIEALRSELATVKAHHDANTQAHQEYRLTAAQEAERIAADGARAVAAVQAQLDGMKDELKSVRVELAAERSASSKAQSEAARLQGQVEVLQSDAKKKPNGKS